MKMQSCLFDKRFGAIRGAALAAVLSLGGGFIQHASAGCLDVPRGKTPVMDLRNSNSSFGAARFIKADFNKEEEWAPSFFHAPIVGLWAFTYTAKGNAAPPDGTPLDAGATLWFADGNEITYSAVRNPIAGATCLGIWKRTGEFTYVLNHVGLSWDPTATAAAPVSPMNPGGGPGAPGGPAFIKQYIVLSKDAQSYTGWFTITNLKPDGKSSAGPIITGTIKATRVNIDTDTWEPTP
jgi:hypothetical protein